MRPRLHPLLLLALVAGICAGVISGLAWYRARKTATTADLLRRLPAEEAAVLFLDVRPFRAAGLLSAVLNKTRISDEPEYKAFVVETGFDSERDLDAVIIAFRREVTYFLVLGRFRWDRLRQYTTAQGGSCRNAFCQMPGSTPERMVSFFPLRRDLLALAVGKDPWAALQLMQPSAEGTFAVPPGAVWLSLPGSLLSDSQALPSGFRAAVAPLARAERLLLWAEPQMAGLQARLEVTCRSEQEAALLAGQLSAVTRLLAAGAARQGPQTAGAHLAGLLSRSSFRHSGRRVFGNWPVDYGALATLLGESF